MKGTEKQIAWAEDIRAKFIREQVPHYVKQEMRDKATAACMKQDDAKFWIDNREELFLMRVSSAMKIIAANIN